MIKLITVGQIKEDYLIHKYSEGEKKIKLKSIKNDKEAFRRLIDKDDEPI